LDTIGSSLPFWAIATAFAAAAAALVAIPLFKGSARRHAILLAVLLPAAAVGIYLLVGRPEVSAPATTAAVPESSPPEKPAGHTVAELEALLAQQKAKVAENPDDAAGWAALGLSYTGTQRWPEAEQAYARAYALQPQDAFVVSAYAEAMAVNAGRDLSGQPMKLVREALELNGQDAKALELAGINAFQQKEFSKAHYYFRQLLKTLPEESDYAAEIRGAMLQAKASAEEAAYGAPLDTRAPGDAAHGPTWGTIAGTVELDPALAGKVKGSEALFLFARPVIGDGTPLAGLRTTTDRLPADFRLDDSQAPLPDNPISHHDTVTLTARISFSGSPEPMPGDLEGQIRSVVVGSQRVKLVIDTVRQ